MLNPDTFQDRLVRAMKEKGFKQIDIVRSIGVSKGTVSNWVSGKTLPEDPRVLTKLANKLEVSIDWLATGKTPSPSERHDREVAFITVVKREEGLLPEDPFDLQFFIEEKEEELGEEKCREYLEELANSVGYDFYGGLGNKEFDDLTEGLENVEDFINEDGDNYIKEDWQEVRKVPILTDIQAGNWTEVVERGYYEDYTVIHGDYGKNVFAIKLVGHSMQPDFNEGDLIIVDPDIEARPGDYVVAKLQGKNATTFKKYRPRGFDEQGQEYFQLIPSNEDYPILDSRYTPFEVCAVAVERKQILR